MKDKTVCITGGTGSLGQELVEEIQRHEPKAIRVLSRNEYQQFQMMEKFPDVRYQIGDVRDRERLIRAFHKCDYVIHSAALKHISTCEYNPIEAVKTNIDGCVNVVEACVEAKVPRCLFISSDKAVYPINLYGATKLVGEKLFIRGNVYGRTKFGVIRFGNFYGSAGSVVEIWTKQRDDGKEIAVTDTDMSRYWITFEEATKFIISCIERMEGGEIFIPIMPSIKLGELLQQFCPDAKIKIVGRRRGEKMDEDLITEDENLTVSREFDRIIIRGWRP